MLRIAIAKSAWRTSLESWTESIASIPTSGSSSGNGSSYKMILCHSWCSTRRIKSCHTWRWSSWSWWLSSTNIMRSQQAVSKLWTGLILRVSIDSRWLSFCELTKRHSSTQVSSRFWWSILQIALGLRTKIRSIKIWLSLSFAFSSSFYKFLTLKLEIKATQISRGKNSRRSSW